MYSSSDIAKFFLHKSVGENIAITNLKLQKMLYIAHGLHLALTGEPLLEERVECWPYGPVIKEIYYEYKNFGNGPITPDANQKEFNFDQSALQALDYTWETAKFTDPIKLSNWTHIEGSPWKRAFDENKSVIPNHYIEEYFKQFLKEHVE